jgi:hypothetical protein
MNREVHVRFWEGLAVRFRWATQLSRLPRAMKTHDQFDRCSYSSGGTTPANVNRSVIRKSPGVADGSTGVQFGRAAR